MKISRRNFLEIGGGALASSFVPAAFGGEEDQPPAVASRPKTLLRAHMVYEVGSGDVLSASNEHEPCNPASITKLVTAAAFCRLEKEGLLTSSKKEIAAAKTDLRRALIVSDNFAAERIALFLNKQESIANEAKRLGYSTGAEWTYGELIANPMASDLGMENTRTWLASGLPGSYENKNVPYTVTTVNALRKLCDYIYREHPQIIEICAQPYVDAEKKAGLNTNPLLQNSPRKDAKPYSGVDGLKTGYIDAAGYNLIVSAIRNNHRIVAISIGSRTPEERIKSVTALLDDGFAKLDKKYRPELQQQPQPFRLEPGQRLA